MANNRCECEEPGFFYSGVSGVIARVQHGQLVVGAVVERCDLCERFPTDQAAKDELRCRGMISPIRWLYWLTGFIYAARRSA